MPRGDRTGPDGRGPMTGRRAGYCAGYYGPGHANDRIPPIGMGRGRGRGGGHGRGRGGGRGQPYPYPDYIPVRVETRPEDEVAYLEETAKRLEDDLRAIKDRLEELSMAKEE